MEALRERRVSTDASVPIERPVIPTGGIEETAAAAGLSVENELAARIAARSESSSADLLGYELPEERRERILHMLDALAVVSAKLTAEFCKEDHGTYMALWSKVEELASRLEAHLITLEKDVEATVAPDPGWIIAALATFLVKYRKLYGHFEEARRRRTVSLEAIRDYRKLVERQRRRASEVHEEAVQHIKRLLLQEDEDYRVLNHLIAVLAERAMSAEKKDYWNQRDKFREDIKTLKAEMPRLEQEAYDRALQKVQESDNGPRQK